jgi:hypothetical protein
MGYDPLESSSFVGILRPKSNPLSITIPICIIYMMLDVSEYRKPTKVLQLMPCMIKFGTARTIRISSWWMAGSTKASMDEHGETNQRARANTGRAVTNTRRTFYG